MGQVGRRERKWFRRNPNRHARQDVAWRTLRRLREGHERAALRLCETKHASGIDAVGKKELLAAIGNDEEGFRYLQTTEIILPRDFWNPTHFLLESGRRLDRRVARLMWIFGSLLRDEPRATLR